MSNSDQAQALRSIRRRLARIEAGAEELSTVAQVDFVRAKGLGLHIAEFVDLAQDALAKAAADPTPWDEALASPDVWPRTPALTMATLTPLLTAAMAEAAATSLLVEDEFKRAVREDWAPTLGPAPDLLPVNSALQIAADDFAAALRAVL